MNTKKQEQLNAIKNELIKVSVVDSVGVLLVGLAVYGTFVADDDFHPLFKNEWLVSGMFVVGVALMLWGLVRVLKVVKQQKEINNRKLKS